MSSFGESIVTQAVLAKGVLARSSARRVTGLVRSVFARQYLNDGGQPAAYLKFLLERQTDNTVIRQAMPIYTARIHRIPRDFIAEEYWGCYSAGADTVSRTDAEEFIKHAMADGRILLSWSETMQLRVARYPILFSSSPRSLRTSENYWRHLDYDDDNARVSGLCLPHTLSAGGTRLYGRVPRRSGDYYERGYVKRGVCQCLRGARFALGKPSEAWAPFSTL